MVLSFSIESSVLLCLFGPVTWLFLLMGFVVLVIVSLRFETFIACTEADFENRPCARKNCARLVRGACPTGPRKFVRKMCGGMRKYAEIVRNLCGGALAQ